jgi:uncharacterized membrane protein
MGLFLALHVLSAVIWVGGMFFAHMVLRPGAAVLEPAVRLPLWHRVLRRFFLWVWVAVALLVLTGFPMISSLGGLAAVAPNIHIMMVIGLIMAAIFAYLYFVPWQRFVQAVGRQDWEQGARSLGQIRLLVTINLVLGLLTVLDAVSGAFIF